VIKRKTIFLNLGSIIFLTSLTLFSDFNVISAQNKGQKPKDAPSPWDLDKYAITDYDQPEIKDHDKRKNRRIRGQRYDKSGWVYKLVNPKTDARSRISHRPFLPTIPVNQSDLIVVGEVTTAKAFLSHDKTGIYTEYGVKTIEILKSNNSMKTKIGCPISIDRAGGYVRYPNGQKVLFFDSERDLPTVGKRYVFFLNKKDGSPNYHILLAYEFNGNKVFPLNSRVPFSKYRDEDQQFLLKAIRAKIVSVSTSKK